ncbi:MAG: malonyl-CoA decarboxylase [Rhizobiaceae bacterium]
MKNSGFLGDLIASIIDRKGKFASSGDDRSIQLLCRELLSSRGEVSSRRIGTAILGKYQELDVEGQLAFFSFLNEEMDLDTSTVEDLVCEYRDDRSADTLERLSRAAEPPRQELLRRLNHVPGATPALVAMRKDLLDLLPDYPELRRIDVDFTHLFVSWFNRGFLVVKPISWHTPADVLAKIIQYEAVHAIEDWDDLRRRLQPEDRRCFAFFHPAIPDDPLVFVEVALCRGIPKSVQALLIDERAEIEQAQIDTAVFYSISNCQQGLRGISFGNFLIKQVVSDLSGELPQLKTFVTLSPLPGFSRWLEGIDSPVSREFVADIREELNKNASLPDRMQKSLRTLAARYLTESKRADGLPVDPVARFHLSNGAAIHDIHALADTSQNGLKSSYGVMVNYHYDRGKVESRHESFVQDGTVAASKPVRQLAQARIPEDAMRIAEEGAL